MFKQFNLFIFSFCSFSGIFYVYKIKLHFNHKKLLKTTLMIFKIFQYFFAIGFGIHDFNNIFRQISLIYLEFYNKISNMYFVTLIT